MSSKTVTIIGAGLSGLICGKRLSEAGFNVMIIEELTYSGGLLASNRMGKDYIELLPHHLRKTDRASLNLIREEGLEEEVEWFDSLWYGRASKKKVGYFKKGFISLISMLMQDITDNGGRIMYSTTVSEIVETPDYQFNNDMRYTVSCVLNNSSSLEFKSDYVIFTGSCRTFVNVSHGLPISMNIRDQLMNISYKSALCLMMVLRKSNSEVYIQRFNEGVPFNRIVNHSNMTGPRNYGGNVVYLVGSCYISDDIWVASDSEIMNQYFTAFHKLYPTIKKSDIKSWRLTKIRYAAAERYPEQDLSNPMPGLYICSSGLTETSNTNPPENRMDKMVTLSNKICKMISEEQNSTLSEVLI